MGKDNNIVSKRDYLEVFNYLFGMNSSIEEMQYFNSFWKKHIKNKSIPFGDLDLFKVILKKYNKAHVFYSLTTYYIKFESLYLRIKPDTDKDINIFLNLCDIMIKELDSISIDTIEDFYNLFKNKDNLLKVLDYMKDEDNDLFDDIIDNFEDVINVLKRIRSYFIEEEFCQIVLFILEACKDSNLIFNIDQDNLVDSLYDFIYKTIINNNYSDKLNVLEKLKSLRDKYKNIEKSNNGLSNNLDKYNNSLTTLETYLEEEIKDLKKQERLEDSSDSMKDKYMKTYTNYSPHHNKYHSKFDLVTKCLFMNNYVCISGPKECGKKAMIDEINFIFTKRKLKNYSFKYEDLITINSIVKIPEIYEILINGGVLSIEIDKNFEENNLLNDLINATKNLNNYIKINNNLIKINPNFRLCIINHNNQEFNKYIKKNFIINVECDYDEKLEEELTNKDYMDFFREYRKDLKEYDIVLTTKDIVFPRNSYEMLEFFIKIDRQIKEKIKNDNLYRENYYINLTKNYDPSNLLYNLFNEWQLAESKGIGCMLLEEDHQKTLIKRMKR